MPYQPFFVEQVSANNVREISSTSDSIDGTLKKEATYTPPDGGDPVKVSEDFKTEVPSFIDNKAVTELLTEHHVVINASAPSSGGSRALDDPLRLPPDPADHRLLPLADPQTDRRRKAAASSAASVARPRGGWTRTAKTGSPSRTSPGSTRPRRSWKRSSTSSKTRTATPSSGRGSRTACCCTGRRGPARRCSRAPSPARPTPPTSTSRPRSSSRRSSASAPRGSAISSNRPKRPPRRSSSSTSSTRSAGRARATSAGSRAATTSASRRSTRSSPRWTASSPAPT